MRLRVVEPGADDRIGRQVDGDPAAMRGRENLIGGPEIVVAHRAADIDALRR